VQVAQSERNMRVHLIAAAAVAALGCALPLGLVEQLALLGATFAVIAAELVNSALEGLADLVTLEQHEGVRVVKDAAAAAVLVVSVGAVVVLAVVVLASWSSWSAVAPERAWRVVAVGLPQVVLSAFLVLRLARPLWLERAALVLGTVWLASLAAVSQNQVFTGLGALVFLVSAAVARASRGRREAAQ